MKTNKLSQKSRVLIFIAIVMATVWFLSDWVNFKAGLMQKPPVEKAP